MTSKIKMVVCALALGALAACSSMGMGGMGGGSNDASVSPNNTGINTGR